MSFVAACVELMKRAASFTALALGACYALATHGGELARDLSVPRTLKYEVVCKQTTFQGTGDSEPRTVDIAWTAEYKIDQAGSDGKATIESTTKNFKFMAKDNIRMRDESPDRKATAKIGRLDGPRTSDVLPTSFGWLVVDHLDLPGGEPTIGRTWGVLLPRSIPLGENLPKLQAKLVGEEEANGKPVWVVTIDAKQVATSQEVKVQAGGGEPMSAKITGKANIHLRLLIDKVTGNTVLLTAKVTNDQELEFPGAPVPTPSTIEYSATMKLVQ